MWTRFSVHAYVIPSLHPFVNGYHPIKIQKRGKELAGLTSRSLRHVIDQSPSNCFFFASNSSWVIIPLSRSSLYFFSSSAEETSCFTTVTLDGVSCLWFISLFNSSYTLSLLAIYTQVIFPEEVATAIPSVNIEVLDIALIESIGNSTVLLNMGLYIVIYLS